MQYPDGSGKVSHKVSTLEFCGFIMPEAETDKRYFTDWGSAATADFVAMMAMAAGYFKPYDADYAQNVPGCGEDELRSSEEGSQRQGPHQRAFSTGGYGTSDWDDRLWAAAEMWETTGDAEYLKDFEARVPLLHLPAAEGVSARPPMQDLLPPAKWMRTGTGATSGTSACLPTVCPRQKAGIPPSGECPQGRDRHRRGHRRQGESGRVRQNNGWPVLLGLQWDRRQAGVEPAGRQ